jgi:formate-dependent nitrite reductase membrane component NrfD
MMELESRSQGIWGWRIAIYLFFGGLGGGCYLVGILHNLLSPHDSEIAKIGVLSGVSIVFAGTLILLTDLGRPGRAARAIIMQSTSWISRGTLILGVFLIIGTIHIAFWIWPFNWLIKGGHFHIILGGINGFFAVMTIIYTGLLLGTFRPIPFWCNPLLPALFLVSSISAAMMAISLIGAFWNLTGNNESHSAALLISFEIPTILFEGLLVFFYLQGSHLLEASRSSVNKIIRGNLAPFFWFGFIFVGLLLPLTGSVIHKVAAGGNGESLFLLTMSTAVSALLGGFLLRYVIVMAGIKVPLNVGGVIVLPNPEA